MSGDDNLAAKFDREYSKHPHKDIRKCLRALKSNPTQTNSSKEYSGVLFKVKTSNGAFRIVNVRLAPDECALYYSSSSTGNGTKVKIGYISVDQVNVKDKLAIKQEEETSAWCKYRLRVWTKTKQHIFTAANDDEFQPWIEASQSLMQSKFSNEQIDEKEKAIAKLRPLVEAQMNKQIEKYQALRKTLDKCGMLGYHQSHKLKRGDLKILSKDDNKYIAFHVVLTKRYIMFFPKDSKKKLPTEIVSLQYLLAIDSKPGARHCTLVTPLNSFKLRAKHDVAIRDWVSAIETALQNRKVSNPTHQLFTNEELQISVSPTANPILTYQKSGLFGSKTKKFTLKANVTTIGRAASSNHIWVEDSCMSRNHAKVEIIDGVPIIYDLGSSSGTKVNGEVVSKKPLKQGDEITLGNTIFTLQSN